MEDRRTKFNKKIRNLLEHALEKEGFDFNTLAQKIGEPETEVQACFDNAAKCQPEVLFKASKALSVEREMMLLVHFYSA